LVIAFIGWIMNLVNSNKTQPPPPRPADRPRRPPRPREDRLQSEIDLFLEEVSGRRQVEPSDIEIIEPIEEPQRRPLVTTQETPSRPSPSRPSPSRPSPS